MDDLCNDGSECTVDQCNGASGCVFVPGGCDDDNACTLDICNEDETCAHEPETANVVCRAATNSCDVTETCDGTSTQCPADGHLPDDTSCDDDTLTCTVDVCEGGQCTHPTLSCTPDANPCTIESCIEPGGCTSAPGNPGAECRAATDACDAAEQCDGVNAECPVDDHVADGTTCTDDLDVCTSDVCSQGACTHPAAPPAVTFVSLNCRLAALAAQVANDTDGNVETRLLRLLARAIDRKEGAENTTDPQKARAGLRAAHRRMVVFSHRVSSLAGRRQIADVPAAEMSGQADGIAADMLALRATL